MRRSTLNDLYHSTERESVDVINNFPLHRIKSLTIYDDCSIGIAIKQGLSAQEERVVLAHELGHYYTGTYYQIFSPFELISRYEYRADACMLPELIPPDELVSCLEDGLELWELAEEFDVPEQTIERVIDIYRRKGWLK